MSEPDYWKSAIIDLSNSDCILSKIIFDNPDVFLVSRGDPFFTLVRSIVGQQISVRSASAIWSRLEGRLHEVTPSLVLQAGRDILRECGITRQKSTYIYMLAESFESGKIKPEIWDNQDDESIIKELTLYRGIGRWTAEMFLIFYLARPDILPMSDLGLRRAITELYSKKNILDDNDILLIADKWRPWRSVATWYLWRFLDPEPVEY
tara:strand:+ start:11626 stop:12246 length:621 start_codon:yes stop_codon:yes gene_type:complete